MWENFAMGKSKPDKFAAFSNEGEKMATNVVNVWRQKTFPSYVIS